MNSSLGPINPTFFFTANSELLSNCIYLTSSKFHKIPFLLDTFSAFHINMRSPKHFDDLSENLLSLNMLFSADVVSGTWLHKSIILISLIFLPTILSPIQERIN